MAWVVARPDGSVVRSFELEIEALFFWFRFLEDDLSVREVK